MNVTMVCGARRTNAGVQPLNNAAGPSLRIVLTKMDTGDRESAEADEFMTRVLITSTGEQTVVATRP